jgi:hypothetical protein
MTLGVASEIEQVSKISFVDCGIGMLSPVDRHKARDEPNMVFIPSIQLESTGPSKISHCCSCGSSRADSQQRRSVWRNKPPHGSLSFWGALPVPNKAVKVNAIGFKTNGAIEVTD